MTAESKASSLKTRLAKLDWQAISRRLDDQGFATIPPLLTPSECDQLVRLYRDDQRFRSRIDMARFRFGEGEYKYFGNPLPDIVQSLRAGAYPNLAAIANAWSERLGTGDRYPGRLEAFLEICCKHGQRKPTPLILYYNSGGYNCMHQDLYGEIAFPLQMACLLNRPGQEFTGGELLLIEQRPRAQSRGIAISLQQGEALIFPNRYRPISGTRGSYRVNVRHGVSTITSGERYSLGIIFHDAK
jgi:hypothetical protein